MSRLLLLTATLLLGGLLVAQALGPTPGGEGRALLDAVNRRDAGAVERLLQSGAPPDATDETGWTALMHAATLDEPEICEHLIRHGARVDSRQPYFPLQSATVLGCGRAVDVLLRHGASADAPSDAGITPLMVAALFGHSQIVQSLVEAGADINAADPEGDTALHMAALGDQAETARLLLHYGADPRRRNLAGQTPGDAARARGHFLLAGLLDRGADGRVTSPRR